MTSFTNIKPTQFIRY